jgi:cob(I)alamin adenosyltransferase
MKGYIQIYTGNGKGKTTASIGLTLRAIGAGKKVFLLNLQKDKYILKSKHWTSNGWN